MEFFELMDITHSYLDILNPSNPEKILKLGEVLELEPDDRVIDFGCGNGELLVLWTEEYGITGTGVDISEQFCEKARIKIKQRNLEHRIEIIQADGKAYASDEKYDAGLCIGATFIWGDYRKAIQGLREFVKPGGRIAIGEPHWLKSGIPQEYLDGPAPPGTLFEHELLRVTNEEGYGIEYIIRASHDDWDRYNTGRWKSVVRWLLENPDHPERSEIIDYLHNMQDEYLRYEREYIGWAIYILHPMSY